jgi:DNA invertase Pin-like site-specific DNA recombinase
MTTINLDSPFACPIPRSMEERKVAAAARGVIIIGRQSDPRQAKLNLGSQAAQVQFSLEETDAAGIPRSWIKLVAAWGETGTTLKPRPFFEQILALVVNNQVGLIVVQYYDRTGRNLADEGRLLEAASKHGVLFLINGDLLDPRKARDRRSLASDAVTAEFDNNTRIERFAGAKLVLARSLAFRTRLPTGLVWASPRDSRYVEAMKNAGLRHWLDRTPDHRVRSTRDATTLYILPWPDADVIASLEMRFKWLFELRSLIGVYERINSGYPGWPTAHVGQLPYIKQTAFYDPDTPVIWNKLDRYNLKASLKSLAYYGIYSVYSHRLASTETVARRQRRNKKGAAYGRAIAIARPPLPSAIELINSYVAHQPTK